MKHLFFILILVLVIVGIGFYFHRSQDPLSKGVPPRHPPKMDDKQVSVSAKPTPLKSVEAATTTSEKKGCACCLSTLAKIKARRKALEMWAREMIETHGYEEGMKRVTEKSQTLAKRIQRLLEKEKVHTIPVITSQ